MPEQLELPEPCVSNFPKDRLPFAAGHPDRFLFGYFLQPTTVYANVKTKANANTNAPSAANDEPRDFTAMKAAAQQESQEDVLEFARGFAPKVKEVQPLAEASRAANELREQMKKVKGPFGPLKVSVVSLMDKVGEASI